MSIATVHATMKDDLRGQGPLFDTAAGRKIRQNRGVARAHKAQKRQAAQQRDLNTPWERTRRYRRLHGLDAA